MRIWESGNLGIWAVQTYPLLESAAFGSAASTHEYSTVPITRAVIGSDILGALGLLDLP